MFRMVVWPRFIRNMTPAPYSLDELISKKNRHPNVKKIFLIAAHNIIIAVKISADLLNLYKSLSSK